MISKKIVGHTCLVKRMNLRGQQTLSRAEIISVGRKWVKVRFVETGETGLITPDQIHQKVSGP